MPTYYNSNESELQSFSSNLLKMGIDITGYDENDRAYLLKVAKQCTKQVGIPLGVAIGAATSGVGSVSIPFIGAVPGYVAGFLAGAVGGTLSCTVSKIAIKRDLDTLLKNTSGAAKSRKY